MKKSIQFELWQECNNHCAMCYIPDNLRTPDEIKIKSLTQVLEKISDESVIKEYEVISYLGGEFFQGQLKNPEVKELFFKVMRKTAELYNTGKIQEVWIYATMTIGDQQDLFDTFDLFDKSKNGLWLLTSWDTIYRFTDKKLAVWEDTVKKAHERYPLLKMNTTTIISEDLCTKYLRGDFTFEDLSKKYGTTFFFKQCGCPGIAAHLNDLHEQKLVLPHFYTTKKMFRDFLIKFKKQESDIMWDKLFNIQYRADLLYRNFNEDGKQMMPTERHKDSKNEITLAYNKNEMAINTCGHLLTYSCFTDDDTGCAICEKEKISKIMG